MKIKSPTHIRVGNKIQTLNSKEIQTFPSIAKAKKHSHALQKIGGYLGDGRVRVAERFE